MTLRSRLVGQARNREATGGSPGVCRRSPPSRRRPIHRGLLPVGEPIGAHSAAVEHSYEHDALATVGSQGSGNEGKDLT